MSRINAKWLHDTVNANLVQLHSIKRVLFSGQSRFQSIDIIETDQFGLCLVIDGKIQSGEKDEFIYHESLVHPVMLTHPEPKRVFIAGGGEGGTLREVLLHNTVETAVMVDIDAEVIDVCRRFLPAFNQGSFSDSRASLHISDARAFLEATEDRFDVAILDLTDPCEEGPSCSLYTRDFYELVKARLAVGGILCLQGGPSGWVEVQNYGRLLNIVRGVFSRVCPYQSHMSSFCDLWGFISGSDSLSPAEVAAAEIDRRIARRLSRPLRAYDGLTHQFMFSLAKHTRQELDVKAGLVA
ncbi:MAG: spermidine synthase [Chloroflexota bacterium]